MLYPIVDRRISSTDRRGHPDRRSEDRGTPAIEQRRRERRTRGDRRQINLDRERLLRNLRLPGYREEDEPRWFKYARLWLLPIVIAGGTTAISIVIADMQSKTATAIAEMQSKTAKAIAEREQRIQESIQERDQRFQESIRESEQENAIERAEAELKTRRLEKIIDIFSKIIGDKPSDEKELGDKEREVLRQKILSLVAYRDEALPFLVQLRNYGHKEERLGSSANEVDCQGVDLERVLACVVRNAARDSIAQILGESQLDIRAQIFEGKGEALNLRHREYVGYNMSGSEFNNVNLFKSDFSGATLTEVEFYQVDLVDAIFEGANLKHAVFWESDLKYANFQNAKLDGVRFENCRNVGKAKFSLNALLDSKKNLIASLNSEDYIWQLKQYEEELQDIARSESGNKELEDALCKANVKSFAALEARWRSVDMRKRSSEDPIEEEPQVALK